MIKLAAIRIDFNDADASHVVFGEDLQGQWFLIGMVDEGPFDTTTDLFRKVATLLLRHSDAGRLVL